MSSYTLPMRQAMDILKIHYHNAEKAERIVIEYAASAAALDAVSSVIPGLAIPATIAECFGVVWLMYGRICKELGITVGNNVLKLIARAVLSNIGANLGGALIALFAAMLVPGASVAASAVVAFITVYLAGLIFLRLVAELAEEGDPYDFNSISSKKVRSKAKKVNVSAEDLEAAQEVYRDHQS